MTKKTLPNQCYDSLTNSFLEVVNKHVPLKKKTIRGSHASFVNKELRKVIYTRSRLRDKMCQKTISENIKKKSLLIYLTAIIYTLLKSLVALNLKPSPPHADEIQHIVNLYKDHPSIKQIKKKIIPESHEKQVIFPFKLTTVENVKKLLNEIHTKKALGIDTIPLKLIKMASKFLAPIYTTAINSIIENSVFRKNAKVATAVPLDKGKPDKNDISDFRPVILLNTFFKVL